MPYIIATTDTRLYADDPTAEFEPNAKPVQTRRAVATLEKARQAADDVVTAYDVRTPFAGELARFADAAMRLESGGTVVLPDGTVIEVKHATYQQLAREAGCDGMDYMRPDIIDAFNAVSA